MSFDGQLDPPLPLSPCLLMVKLSSLPLSSHVIVNGRRCGPEAWPDRPLSIPIATNIGDEPSIPKSFADLVDRWCSEKGTRASERGRTVVRSRPSAVGSSNARHQHGANVPDRRARIDSTRGLLGGSAGSASFGGRVQAACRCRCRLDDDDGVNAALLVRCAARAGEAWKGQARSGRRLGFWSMPHHRIRNERGAS